MAERFAIAKSIADATFLKNEKNAYLAGGTEINRLGSSVKAKNFVSISKLNLKGVSNVSFGGSEYLKIGALNTFQELLDNSKTPEYLKQACSFMSSRQKRDMATIGGNIASMRDDSYLIPTLLSVKAELELVSNKGNKTGISLQKYIERSDKYKNHLITDILIPYKKLVVESKRYSNTAASHGYITVAVSNLDGDKNIGLCVKNSGIYNFCNEKPSKVRFKEDIFGSIEYKKYLLDVTVEELSKKVFGGEK